jgi:hypothetical protein
MAGPLPYFLSLAHAISDASEPLAEHRQPRAHPNARRGHPPARRAGIEREITMFMMLMNALALIAVIGLAVLAFMFAGAALGALIGNILAAVRCLYR